MQPVIKFLSALCIVSLLFTACSKNKDDVPASPLVTDVEIGSGNNKIAYTGSDLHLEAQIIAPGTIANVQVEIHPVSGTGWKFDSVYVNGFQGLKNAEFHKHIDIPADAAVGFYHLHFIVTDQRGQQKKIEDEIEIKTDPTMPAISGLDLGVGDNGAELHVETVITAPNKIAQVDIEIHGNWEKEIRYTDAAMVGQTTYNFHKHINIEDAPPGHYHVHFKVIDQAGKEKEFEDHFDKP